MSFPARDPDPLEGRELAVDPGIASFLAPVNRKPPQSKPVSLAQARRGIYRLAEIVAPQTEIAMYSVEDATIPGPVTGIPIRTYRPTADPGPTAVYFHGGGWMTGSIASHDFLVRKLARESGLAFVSVSDKARRAIEANPHPRTFYFDLKKALVALKDNDTPYTPA